MDLYHRISFVVEMIVLLFPFTKYWEKNNLFLTKMIVGFLSMLFINGFWKNDWGIFFVFLRYFIVILFLFGILLICFREKINAKLFALTATYSVQTILYSCYTSMLFLLQQFFTGTLLEIIQCICYLLIFGTGFVISYRIFSKRMNENKNVNVDNRIIIVLACCIILISNIFNILIIQANIPAYAYELVYKPMSIVPCVLLLCLQFNLINNQALQLEKNTLGRLLKEKDEQYQMSKENIELIQMKCHDLKYQIEAFRQNNKDADQKALREIQKNINIYDGIVKTGNEALDVILTEKSLFCEKKQIKITMMIDGSKLNKINVSDLYCIFGNVIDNAIEAVEKEKDVEKRVVSITSNLIGNLFSIRIVNYFSGELQLENGIPVSSKSDKRFHGYGIKSIMYIMEKYGGNISIHHEEDLFVLNLLFPLK